MTPGGDQLPSADPGSLPIKAQRYILQWTGTTAGTGFFAPLPEGEPDFATALAWLQQCPMDSFLHRYLLQDLVSRPADLLAVARAEAAENSVLHALLLEAAYLLADPALESALAPTENEAALERATPAIFLRHRRLADRAQHHYWIQQLAANIFEHRPLAGADAQGAMPLPCTGALADEKTVSIDAIPAASEDRPVHRAPIAETIALASERLARANILASVEMRHEASLSPVALLRRWRLERRVRSGRLHYRLGGFMTAYGRGSTLEAARVSCLMEIVERYSAFGDFSPEAVDGHSRPVPLINASLSELKRGGHRALDPNDLGLEVPWNDDAPLRWRPARIIAPHGENDIWIPAQCVYLFCNLDEPDLFSALGSTGLASGSSMAEARLAALLEIVERDAEATTPFDPAACFTIDTGEAPLNALLGHYRNLDIHVQFQDLTGSLGIPCYKCFVIAADGRIIKGTGAHLDGRRALLAALTETMYPYPNSPASRPCLPHLPVRSVESLPDYSSRSAAADLQRLQQLLLANGLSPIFADLTRADIEFPVVRSVVPGLAMVADFDRFSRLTRRQASALRRAVGPVRG